MLFQVGCVVGGLLDHVTRDHTLTVRHGHSLGGCLLTHWPSLTVWWEGGGVSGKLAALTLLKKMLLLDSKVDNCTIVYLVALLAKVYSCSPGPRK